MAVAVLLVHPVTRTRRALRRAIDARDGLSVAAEVSDGAVAAEIAREVQPDVVVLSVELTDLASRDVLARVRAASPRSQVVVYGSAAHSAERAVLAPSADGAAGSDQGVAYLVDLVARLGNRQYQARSMHLGRHLAAARRARRFAGELLERWGCRSARDATLTVVSELVANAVLHARSECELRLSRAEGVLHIEVTDSGRGVPAPRQSGPQDAHGRGLLLVSELCSAWGMYPLPGGGKVVWAELATLEHHPAAGTLEAAELV